MLNQDQIQAVVQRLVVQLSQPARVILFGSYARDQANADSDLDLLVVERTLSDKPAEYLRLKQAIGRVGVGIDLLLMSAGEFERRRQVPGTLASWTSQEGRVIHESLH